MNQHTFAVFCAVFIACATTMTAASVSRPSECGTRSMPIPNTTRTGDSQLRVEIPEPTKSCPPEVAEWWKDVQKVGRAAVEASYRRDEALREALAILFAQGKPVPDDDEEVLPKQWKQLTEAVNKAREKFKQVLSLATEKSYQVPFEETKPLVLYFPQPRYTEDARRNRLAGTVKGRVLLASDGMVTRVNIRSGLGRGLDERAIFAMYYLIFLPAIKDGQFVTFQQAIEVEFNLR